MPLGSDLKEDISAAKKLRLPWWGIVACVVIGLPIIVLLDRFGKFELVLPTLNSFAVLGFAIALKWRLRRYLWFWVTIAIIVACHVALVLLVPWSTKWIPAVAIAAIDSADLVVVLAAISVVRRITDQLMPR